MASLIDDHRHVIAVCDLEAVCQPARSVSEGSPRLRFGLVEEVSKPLLSEVGHLENSGMAVQLDNDAWMLGETPDQWPRSRYSGAALYPGQMVVSVIVSWAELFGHSYIALEWFADEIPGPCTSRRRHEIYHLRAEPTEAERARGITDPGCLQMMSWRTRPARVVVECDPRFFPLRDSGGRELPAYFRSWLVPFADGWRAREVAAAATACPSRYNYLELGGGKNCARWVLEVSAMAGIDSRHFLSSLVAVPKRLVRPRKLIEEESRMWQHRQTSRPREFS